MARLRRVRSEERGAVLVIVAGMLTVMLAMAALAIDVGSFYQAQRQAQSAADAGALAGSQDLPSNPAGAATNATTYAQKNFPSAKVDVVTNYNNSPKQIKVTVSVAAPAFFGRFLGLTQANVSASAVAGGNGKSVQGAIFAYADNGSCADPGITIDKNNANITGGLQSNGNVTLSGNNGVYGTAVSGTGAGCSGSYGNSTFTDAPFTSAPTAYPLDYRVDNTPVCTITLNGNVTNPSAVNGIIPPGVYCDPTGTITLSSVSGTGVTFVANSIVVANATLTAPGSPGAYGLLLYQTGCDSPVGALTVSGNADSLTGTIFAPCATVDIQKNNGSTGFIEANNVHIAYNNFTITGDGPVVVGSGDGLVQ